MDNHTQNRLIRSLGKVCKEELLREKWLVAPNRRVGHQWVESVVRGGQPAVNLRVQTLKGIALGLASSEMAAKNQTLVPDFHAEILIDDIWNALRDGEKGYIGARQPGFALSKTIFAAVNDLRLAGVDPEKMEPGKFEVPSKGKELAAVSREYIKTLKEKNLVDYADVLRMAAGALRKKGAARDDNAIILIPDDGDFSAMEENLLNSFPEGRLVRLEADRPGKLPDKKAMRIFSTVGEVNEVREILRRCLAEKISFDEVEILHTDRDTYVPLIYETARAVCETAKPNSSEKPIGKNKENCKVEKHDPPVTFAEGIHARYSRPGRALAAWLEWITEGYPQATLCGMIQDGLLEIPEAGEGKTSFVKLADAMRSIPIYHGRERYLLKIDEEIDALEKRSKYAKKKTDEESTEKYQNIKNRQKLVAAIRNFVRELLETTPADGDENCGVLKKSIDFIEKYTSKKSNELDNYSREKLSGEIRKLLFWIDSGATPANLDIREWLEALQREVRVLGSGPRPGCIHVANINSGGHSGRRHTFIAGLDDSRFPGAARQSPLLLDSERKKLSKNLRTSAEQFRRRTEDFARLLARLRGSVTLSFSCRSLQDDREIFPSPALLEIHRAVSGNNAADLDDFYSSLPPPASFAPADEKHCITEGEWWLWRLCGGEVGNAEETLHERFPNLKRGNEAAAQRQSDTLTAYDGFVARAGKDEAPTLPNGPVMSASRLETLGRCPMAYFFRYILKLAPPEEAAADPSVWLDPLAAGSLLHEVFEAFMKKMIDEKITPVLSRDFDSLVKILDEKIEGYKNDHPPQSENAFKRQYNEMREAARTFLADEEIHCKTSRPAFLEACIGIRPDDPSELDTPEPVGICLPNGKSIQARGVIDRVDLADGKKYSIWDYKTGSTYGYSQFDPFLQGRRVQHYLYLHLVRARLAEISPGAAVELVGLFFPGVKGRGERMSWTPAQLSGGAAVLQKLIETAAAGCFLHSDDPGDCRFCDYAAACGNIDVVTASSKHKLSNTGNRILKPFRELRGYET
ncbi:MAG: PD-(D/E)XK nuclease family protein [bacterium]